MTNATLGTAGAKLEVDISDAKAGIESLKQSFSSLALNVEQGSERQVVASKRQIDSLQRQISMYGKSREEVIRWRIEQQTSGKVQEELKAKLDASVASMKAADVQIVKYSMSAKQTAAAMRGVPAQITDIVTSIVSGQNLLLVGLQQGGQLKDMFGGVVPAAKALAAAILEMITPATVGAAALAALGLAAYEGADEQANFAKALATTGSVAGVTKDNLIAMSEALSSDHLTQGKAAEALTAVAASGKIARESFEEVANAAASMQKATGKAINDTVSDFEKIADDPVNATAKLSESSHFLTAALYEQIKALDAQGNHQAAAALATHAYANANIQTAENIKASLGTLEKAWQKVMVGAAEAWNAMLDVGREESMDKRVGDLKSDIAKLQDTLNQMGTGPDRRRVSIEKMIAERRAQMQQLQDAAIAETKAANQKMLAAKANEAVIGQEQELMQYRTNEQKRVDEITKEQGKARAAISAAEAIGNQALAKKIAQNRDALIKAINIKYMPDGLDAAARSASLQGFKDALAQEQAQLKAQTDALKAQYDAREITIEEYYSRLRELTTQGNDVQAGAIEKQIAYLQRQRITGKDAIKDAISVREQIAQLESQLTVSRTQGGDALQRVADEEKKSLTARKLAIREYTDALQDSNTALQRQMQTLAARAGMGDREYEIQQKINEALEHEADERLKLARQRSAHQLDEVSYQADLQSLSEKTADRIDLIRKGYTDLAAAESDWTNGARAALENYAQETANVAGQVQQAMTGAFSGMEDALATFVSTGKLSFKDFANSIINDLGRIAAKQLLTVLEGDLFSRLGNRVSNAATATMVRTNAAIMANNGWATGGYTGNGGKYDPAGIVHRGEYVINAASTRKIGVGYLDRLNGYANGGLVGGGGGAGGVKVEVINNAAPVSGHAEMTQQPDGTQLVRVILNAVADSISSGGVVARAGKQRYGWKEAV